MLNSMRPLAQLSRTRGVPHCHIDVQGLGAQSSDATISRLVIVVGGSSEFSQPGIREVQASVVAQRLDVLHNGIMAMLPLGTELRAAQNVVQMAVHDGPILALATKGPVGEWDTQAKHERSSEGHVIEVSVILLRNPMQPGPSEAAIVAESSRHAPRRTPDQDCRSTDSRIRCLSRRYPSTKCSMSGLSNR